MRLLTFVLALMLLGGAVAPTRGWLIALVMLAGLAMARWRSWRPFMLRPAFDMRLGAFILAVLLLAGTIEPTRSWLAALSAVAGIAMVLPGIVRIPFSCDDHYDFERRMRRHAWRYRYDHSGWDGDGWR